MLKTFYIKQKDILPVVSASIFMPGVEDLLLLRSVSIVDDVTSLVSAVCLNKMDRQSFYFGKNIYYNSTLNVTI